MDREFMKKILEEKIIKYKIRCNKLELKLDRNKKLLDYAIAKLNKLLPKAL